MENCRIEGRESNDWKLVDANDVIVHIFHPEKREFYDLEKMWSEEIPKEKAIMKKIFIFFYIYLNLIFTTASQKMIFMKKLIFLVRF